MVILLPPSDVCPPLGSLYNNIVMVLTDSYGPIAFFSRLLVFARIFMGKSSHLSVTQNRYFFLPSSGALIQHLTCAQTSIQCSVLLHATPPQDTPESHGINPTAEGTYWLTWIANHHPPGRESNPSLPLARRVLYHWATNDGQFQRRRHISSEWYHQAVGNQRYRCHTIRLSLKNSSDNTSQMYNIIHLLFYSLIFF